MIPVDRRRAQGELHQVQALIQRVNPGRVIGLSLDGLVPSNPSRVEWEESGGLARLARVVRQEDHLTPRLSLWAQRFTETLETVLDGDHVRLSFARELQQIMRSSDARSSTAPSWLRRHLLSWIDRQLGPPTRPSLQERMRTTFDRLNQAVNRTETRLQETREQIDAMGPRVASALDQVEVRVGGNQALEQQMAQVIRNTVEEIREQAAQFAQNFMEPVVEAVEETVRGMERDVDRQREETRALTATLVRHGTEIAKLHQEANRQKGELQQRKEHIANMEQKAEALAQALVEVRAMNDRRNDIGEILIMASAIAVKCYIVYV